MFSQNQPHQAIECQHAPMNRISQSGTPNQTLQATAVKRLGWQVERQRPAVPELIRWVNVRATFCSSSRRVTTYAI
jgi:hypothetical protein